MSWQVRFIDYPAQYEKLRDEILRLVDGLLLAGDVMLRQQLEDFESSLAAFVGTKYAVGVSNCTDGLHLIMRAANIGSGDEVVTVSHTFVATAAAIHHAGATPVLVDIGDDHNMAPAALEAAITPRTKAIVPVHLNGRLCDMAAIMNIAERHDLLVIEDAAQALGGTFKGTSGGAFGLAGCFSFYPAKSLGTYGDAGAVVTNSEKVAQRLKTLRNHGRTPDNDVAEWSFNCRLDNLHAAILDLKLRHLPEWIERRREIARIYDKGLEDVEELRLPPPPRGNGDFFDVFQNYEVEAQRRDALREHLTHDGVETLLPWGGKGIHHFEMLGLASSNLPRTDELMNEAILLPMHCELSNDHVELVIDSIRRFFAT